MAELVEIFANQLLTCKADSRREDNLRQAALIYHDGMKKQKDKPFKDSEAPRSLLHVQPF